MYIHIHTWFSEKKSLLLVYPQTSILEIKFQIKNIFHYHPNFQKIYFNQQYLLNNKSLFDYNINSGAILKVCQHIISLKLFYHFAFTF